MKKPLRYTSRLGCDSRKAQNACVGYLQILGYEAEAGKDIQRIIHNKKISKLNWAKLLAFHRGLSFANYGMD